MSSNIFGYQGVNTPLESLTNGRYNVADYTTLRETVDARLTVLEKQQAVPENVTVNGSLSIVATATGAGTLTAAGSGSFGGTLYAVGNIATNSGCLINQNAQINGNLAIGGVISGNGSGLTNVSATDPSKLPLTGGTMTGTITSRNINIQNGYIISGNGSGLTNVTATDATKLPLAGGTMTGTITSRDITIQNGYAIRGNGSSLNTIGVLGYDQIPGQSLFPPASDAKYYNISLNYSNSCTLNLRDLYPTQAVFPDQVRYVTIVKKAMASALYTVTLNLPVQSGYTWRWATPESDLGTGSITMGTTIFSYTFLLLTDNTGTGIVYLVNKVTM